MKNIKIAIGVATYGLIKSKTAASLLRMAIHSSKFNLLPIFCHGGYIAENYNRIVNLSLSSLCSHTLFIEHDMIFPPDTLEKLFEHDKDVVGTLYNFKKLPLTRMGGFFDDKGELTNTLPTMNELTEVIYIGMGCMLVNNLIFEKFTQPFFPMEQNEEGDRTQTQDAGFCMKARELGFKVWVDPTIEVKHIGDFEY